MKTSEIFTKCIPLIESGESEFICHAIYQAMHGGEWIEEWRRADHGKSHDPCIQPFMDIITSTLDHYGAFSVNVLFSCQSMKYRTNCKNLRLWWLYNLVRQYESLGD